MKRYRRRATLACAAALFVAVTPRTASAQEEKWQVDLAPLYLWAVTTNGNIAVNSIANIPVYLDFKDAASNISGAFTFHGEARKGKWGFLGDVNFIRLSTDVNYTTPILALPVAGTVKLDQTYFNGKVMYEVQPGSRLYHGRRHPHVDDGPGRALDRSDRRPFGGYRHQQDRRRRRRRIHVPPETS